MQYTKAKIYNLALGALLLSRRITDPDTDKSNEATVLNTHWDTAFESALVDMDLDSTATQIDLELVEEEPNTLWRYAHKYPENCIFLRRIQNGIRADTRSTQIHKRVGVLNGQRVIFSEEVAPIAEYIASDLPMTALSANAALAIAYRLAVLSAPLATGKGSKTLIEQIEKKYIVAKAQAQAQDRNENFNFLASDETSEFVEERLS